MFVGALSAHLPASYCSDITQRSAFSHKWLTAVYMSVIHIQLLEEHLGSIPSLVLLSAEGIRRGGL